MYGIYPAQPRDELSAFSRIEGAYRTEGNQLILSPYRLITWDRFYGASSPAVVQQPYPYDGYFDDARYVVRAHTLTLVYTIYPADAPVTTTMILRRAG